MMMIPGAGTYVYERELEPAARVLLMPACFLFPGLVQENLPEKSVKKFADVKGCDEAIAELQASWYADICNMVLLSASGFWHQLPRTLHLR